MKKILFLPTLVIVTMLLGLGITVNAQTGDNATSGQALEIAPPVVTLSANPGETINTKINLRNISNSPLVVGGEVNDFVSAGEDGIPKLIVDEELSDNPYSIKSWINPLIEMTLESKELKDLPVSISVPVDASPGGYYGVIRFTATPPELKDTGVSLSASLGALVFIRVNGDVTEKLTIEEFFVSKDNKKQSLFESTPIDLNARIKNDGNVYEQPVGQVAITDMFGRKVANVNINLDESKVLPDSIRKYTSPLDSSVLGNKKLFGRYKADLKVTYGDKKEVITSSVEFWIIPYRLIIVTAVAFVTGFILLRFSVKRYNAHIIKKAQRRK